MGRAARAPGAREPKGSSLGPERQRQKRRPLAHEEEGGVQVCTLRQETLSGLLQEPCGEEEWRGTGEGTGMRCGGTHTGKLRALHTAAKAPMDVKRAFGAWTLPPVSDGCAAASTA